MPDITMCDSAYCEVSRNCYRHADSGTRASSQRQAYSNFNDDKGYRCRYWWPMTDEDKDELKELVFE